MFFTDANGQYDLNIPSLDTLFSSSSTINLDGSDDFSSSMCGLLGGATGNSKHTSFHDQFGMPDGNNLFFGTGATPFFSSVQGVAPHDISVPSTATTTSTAGARSSASSSSSLSPSSVASPSAAASPQLHLADAKAALLPSNNRCQLSAGPTSGIGDADLTVSAPATAAVPYLHYPIQTNTYISSAPATGIAGSSSAFPSAAYTNTNRTTTSTLSFAAAMDKLFYSGIPENGNASSMYIQVPASENEGGVSGGSEFWISVPWDKVIPKLFEQPGVIDLIFNEVDNRPELRHKAAKRFMQKTLQVDTSNLVSNGTGTNRHNSSSGQLYTANDPYGGGSGMPSQPSSVQMIIESPAQSKSDGSASSKTGHSSSDQLLFSPADMPNLWVSNAGDANKAIGSGFSGFNPSFGRVPPDTPETPVSGLKPWDLSSNQLGDLSLKLPPMPTATRESSPGSMPSSFSHPRFETADGQPVTVMTARSDTIDPFLLAQRDVEHNTYTLEYVWSPADTTLYRAESMQGQQALTEPGSIRLIFPPRTMLLSHEKDGTPATPAYSNAHPHSNEWLKAQVCHRSCPYRAGTASLKRPKTVREHFRKCVYLDEHHPLKVLSALQLAVLERESQGLLPNRRRARVIRMATDSVNKIY